MHPATVTLVISAFLSGAVTAVFVMLVVGIRSGDHRPLTTAPDCHLDAFTRTALGVGIRTGLPARGIDGEAS